ncbi:MAG: thiamine-monophosphate kinase, partial [Candidatus Eremiobacteraeota bacterium]|nr:thiamine-monophosphate kinase [Candidatus Eremiobacteraeota bacterium]
MTTAPAALREDDVVEAIRAIVEPVSNRRIVLGIGDDAALWQPSRSHRSAITTDMLVEGVHFTRSAMSLIDIGWRALMANASDLAAMGARPVLATVALGVPEGTAVDDVRDLYTGLTEASRTVQLDIVGGDLSRAPALTLGISAVGEVRPSNVKARSGGRPGAVLAVTGPLGDARAGLEAATRP